MEAQKHRLPTSKSRATRHGSTSSGLHEPTSRIWYTGFNGEKWESPKDTNTNYGTNSAPALIVYDKKLWPALAAYNGKPHAFHEGYETASVGAGAASGASIGGSIGGYVGAAAGPPRVLSAVRLPWVLPMRSPVRAATSSGILLLRLEIRTGPLPRIPISSSASPTRHRSLCQATSSIASIKAGPKMAKSGGLAWTARITVLRTESSMARPRRRLRWPSFMAT
jgi:hypothetical protein